MNKVRLLSKITLAASVSLALAFTFSCSSASDDGSGDENSSSSSVDDGGGSSSSGSSTQSGNEIIKSYSILNRNSGSFTFQLNDQYNCTESGVVASTRTVDYSIANNILVWRESARSNDTLNFSGTSNNLTGTWTRTKNKSASCSLETDGGNKWYDCKEDWYFTKAEITESTFAATLDYCSTDIYVDESDYEGNGWKMRITGCNTYEEYKGSDVIKTEENLSSIKVSYGSESCNFTNTAAIQIEACDETLYYQELFSEYGLTFEEYGLTFEEVYEAFIYFDFSECLEEIIPYDYLGYSGKALAKQVASPLQALEKIKNSKFYGKKKRILKS